MIVFEFSILSFVLGVAFAILILRVSVNLFPGFIFSGDLKKAKQKIRELEDRIDKKDELIQKAVRAEGENSKN